MEFFRIRKDIPFMKHALVFNAISFITFALAVFFLVTRGLHLSVEFTGGTVMEVAYSQPAELAKVRDTVSALGYPDVQVGIATAELAPDRSGFFLTYNVDEGPRYTFGTIEITSAFPALNVADLRRFLEVSQGAWYDGDAVERSAQAVFLNALGGHRRVGVDPLSIHGGLRRRPLQHP